MSDLAIEQQQWQEQCLKRRINFLCDADARTKAEGMGLNDLLKIEDLTHAEMLFAKSLH